MNFTQVFLGILFFGAMIGIYIGLYLLNKKTPKPAGCEDLKASCGSCHDFFCTNNPAHQTKEES